MCLDDHLGDFWIVEIDDVVLERVEEFVFVGSIISCLCDETVAIQHPVERAWKYFWDNKSLFINRNTCMRRRINLWYNTCARSLIWNLETVTMTISQIRFLEREVLQRVAKLWDLDYMGNEKNEIHLSMHDRWFDHVARLSPERWTYRAASWLSLR